MKVLHVLASVGPLRGGPSFVLRSMVTGLAECGLHVDVVTTDDNGPHRMDVPLETATVDRGVTYRYFPRQAHTYTFSLPMAKWLWSNVGNYDLVHIHAVFTFASTVAAWSARAKGVPYIVRPLGILNDWGLKNRRRIAKKLSFWGVERGILDHASLIHYTSEQERAEAENAGARTDSVVIANPVDFERCDRSACAGKFRSRHPELRHRRLIVFLSRIAEKKGINLLITAFARVHQLLSDTVLVIAGSGDRDLTARLENQVREAGLSDDVLWLGFLQGEEKTALLTDADLFALPSYSENFGVAVVEALFFGLPVIVSDQVGIHQEISRHRAGLVVPCDSIALADAIIAILSEDDLRHEMSVNARVLAEDRFSRHGVLSSLVRTYESLLSARSGNRLKALACPSAR